MGESMSTGTLRGPADRCPRRHPEPSQNKAPRLGAPPREHIRVDRARLPHPLRHYGSEVHALRRTGLGGSPPETVEGVSGCVGEAGLEERVPVGRGEFTGGEGDPGPL